MDKKFTKEHFEIVKKKFDELSVPYSNIMEKVIEDVKIQVLTGILGQYPDELTIKIAKFYFEKSLKFNESWMSLYMNSLYIGIVKLIYEYNIFENKNTYKIEFIPDGPFRNQIHSVNQSQDK